MWGGSTSDRLAYRHTTTLLRCATQQVIEGIVRLSATLRHAPLVFQLVRMRQRLAAAAELYVPCSTPLLEVLRSPALFKKVGNIV